MSLDKTRVIAAIVNTLNESLQAVERMAQMARDETTGEEAKAEGKYDTRATEASYLARGQAWRIAELRGLFAWFDNLDGAAPFEPATVRPGALVELEGEQQEVVFIAPVGGTQVVVDNQAVRVISPASPLGSAMAGLEAEDVFEVTTPRGLLSYAVASVR